MESLVELFCHVDDFCKVFLPTMDKKVICHRFTNPETGSFLDDE